MDGVIKVILKQRQRLQEICMSKHDKNLQILAFLNEETQKFLKHYIIFSRVTHKITKSIQKISATSNSQHYKQCLYIF